MARRSLPARARYDDAVNAVRGNLRMLRLMSLATVLFRPPQRTEMVQFRCIDVVDVMDAHGHECTSFVLNILRLRFRDFLGRLRQS